MDSNPIAHISTERDPNNLLYVCEREVVLDGVRSLKNLFKMTVIATFSCSFLTFVDFPHLIL